MFKKIVYITLIVIGEMESKGHSGNGREDKKTMVSITKLYKNLGGLQDRFILYFTRTPECVYIPHRNVVKEGNKPFVNDQGMTEMEYFFPVSGMKSGAIQKFIAQAEGMKSDDYALSMNFDQHKKGFIIKVCFNNKAVGFQHETFDAITGEPALSFAFVKRDLLNTLHMRKNLFNTAFFAKKK